MTNDSGSEYSLSESEYYSDTETDETEEQTETVSEVSEEPGKCKCKRKIELVVEESENSEEYDSEEEEEQLPVSNIIKLLDLAAGDAIAARKQVEPLEPIQPYHIAKKIKLEREKVDKLLKAPGHENLTLSEKVLVSDLPLNIKALLLRKIEEPGICSSDKSKLNTWTNTVLSLPLGKVAPLPVTNRSSTEEINNFLLGARKILDDTVYGMNSTKEEILDFLTKFITNPSSRGTVLGLNGDKGLAKSRLSMALSKILCLPFFQISMGGLTDSNVLIGHDSTYVGSKCGRIAQNIKKCGAMNPVILLDEIDKVGSESTGKASEVYGVLTHLLDETQNHLFQDLYLDEVPLDLSKALFITTFNDKSKIDPIVLNRIKVIDIKPLMLDEKINITKKFIIPEFCRANKLKVSIKDSLIEYIITRKTKTESGMRNIRQNFETLFNRLNTIQVLEKCGDAKEIHKDFSYKDLTFEKTNDYSLVVTKSIIDTILTGQIEDQTWMSMYI